MVYCKKGSALFKHHEEMRTVVKYPNQEELLNKRWELVSSCLH